MQKKKNEYGGDKMASIYQDVQTVGKQTQAEKDLVITNLKKGDVVFYTLKGGETRLASVSGFGDEKGRLIVQLDNAGVYDNGRVTNYDRTVFTSIQKLEPGKTKLKLNYTTSEGLPLVVEGTLSAKPLKLGAITGIKLIGDTDRIRLKDCVINGIEGGEASLVAKDIKKIEVIGTYSPPKKVDEFKVAPPKNEVQDTINKKIVNPKWVDD
jgi:hypothetical protein